MELDEAYRRIIELDNEEKIGFEYFKRTNKYLDYMDLVFLLNNNSPYNFSLLETAEAREFKRKMLSRLENDNAGMLREQLFIENGVNAEIEHLPRYIDIAEHRHDFFEIVCTAQGGCFHRVEDESAIMKQGDITIIPPNVRHYLRAEPDCITLTIKIRKTTFDSAFSVLMRGGTTLSAYFSQTLYSKHYRNSLTFHCGRDAFLRELFLHMLSQQYEKKRYYNYVLEGLLATFFPYLVQNYENTIELASGDSNLNERMTKIENYMRQNYKDATLTSTAEHFYLSPSYLSTLIKKQTGYTFSSIMQKIKMEHAADLITQTDLKVEQICERVGYQDTTQFIRSFKKYYGITPHRYKVKHL